MTVAAGEELTLYGTPGCHLCDDAEKLLHSTGATMGRSWRYVDIATDDALIARYGERIPVLRCGERELCWPFGLLDVLRMVRGASD